MFRRRNAPSATARELLPKGDGFRIVIRGEDEENIHRAREVNADTVISPSTMGGRLMAHKALIKESVTLLPVSGGFNSLEGRNPTQPQARGSERTR